MLGVDNLDIVIQLNITGNDRARALFTQGQRGFFAIVNKRVAVTSEEYESGRSRVEVEVGAELRGDRGAV